MKRTISIVSLVAVLGGLVTASVYASHFDPGDKSGNGVQPVAYHGNMTCSDLLDAGDFLFEHKIEPVANVTQSVSHKDHPGLSGSLTVKLRKNPKNSFDFTLTGDLVAAGVFVKAGDAGNLYDYRPNGEDADTKLHGTVNPNSKTGEYFGLSHVSFCLAEGGAELEIEKKPDMNDPGYAISPGDDAVFTITVTNNGPATAESVTLVDTLPSALTWTTSTSGCDITGGNKLSCGLGDLASGSSTTVTVTAATTSADCGDLLNPAATADADNADEVSDGGVIRVQCGALKITKTAKHAGSGSANLVATFTLTGQTTSATATVTTDALGNSCVDGLPLDSYSVVETVVPTGYAAPTIPDVVVDSDADCGDIPFAGEEITVENTPLTDVEIKVTSQHAGATSTVISCTDAGGNVVGSTTVSSGSLSFTDLLPTKPDVTLDCQIIVDP